MTAADHSAPLPDANARILVVDDVSDNRLMLSRRLHRLGYHQVSLAADGQEALEMNAAEPFDVMLLDIMMPRVNGIQVLQALRESGRLEHTPVIMISAVTEIDAMVQCLELGAEDYLPKPFNLQLLRARLGTVLAKRALQREVRRQLLRMETELAEARVQQLGMVPAVFPRAAGAVRASVHARMHPAREVGGDLYDAFLLGDAALCIALGDVSDKGMPAALFMARTRSLLRAVTLQFHAVYGQVPRPSQVLAVLNEELCKDNPSCMFVTLVVGLLDLGSGVLIYANAGHLAPFLTRPGSALTEVAARPAIALGVVENAVWPDWQLPLGPGDSLVLVSDGLGDMLDPDGRDYTAARVAAEVQATAGQEPEQVTGHLVQQCYAFAAGTPQADDVTVLALRLDP